MFFKTGFRESRELVLFRMFMLKNRVISFIQYFPTLFLFVFCVAGQSIFPLFLNVNLLLQTSGKKTRLDDFEICYCVSYFKSK